MFVKVQQLFLIKFVIFYFACFTCWGMQFYFNYSGVLSAAMVGFLGTLLPGLEKLTKQEVHAVVYSGAFAGMCTREILAGHKELVLISFFGAAIYLILKPHINGFGGKLGTIAFISSVSLLLVKSLW